MTCAGTPLATTDPVRTQILSGGRDDSHARSLRGLLNALDPCPALEEDYDEAARICRDCHGAGEAIRALTHCLIAPVALRRRTSLLAQDRDFEAIRELTGLGLDG